MTFWENLRLALAALRANKVRSALTMLGIIIGVSSVILLVAIGTGLSTYITNQLEDLGGDSLFVMPGELEIATGGGGSGGMPGAGVGASKFTIDHLEDIKRNAKTIKAVMAYTENNGTIRYRGKSKIAQVAGVGPEYQEVRNQRIDEGSFFNLSQYNAAKKVVVLGKTVAQELFDQESPVGKKVTISDKQYAVAGVLEEKGAFGGIDLDNQVFIPATTAMRQFDMQYLQSFWIQSQGADTIAATKEEVEKILSKTLDDDQFSVIDTKSILGVISRILGVLTAALGGIAAISLLVGGIGIMNIMLVSVTERTREIGLRKAVGATPQVILTQFLIEAVILSLFGGLSGITLGILGSLGIRQFLTTSVTPWSIFLAFGVSALVGVIFGVAPAAKASRLNPIDALRYE
ncbi:FtsX-like permease family protein [Candidatus Shapirobacteria bacterium]|nr:FtsX-like permease family protein [Candidatus Shapirobacteria bacterium]